MNCPYTIPSPSGYTPISPGTTSVPLHFRSWMDLLVRSDFPTLDYPFHSMGTRRAQRWGQFMNCPYALRVA